MLRLYLKKFVNTGFIIWLSGYLVIILLSPATMAENTIGDLKNEIGARETEIEKLEKQAKEYQITIQQKEKTAETLDDAIDFLDGQINSLTFKINITERKIEKTILTIQELGLEIKQKTDDIERNRRNMSGILRTIYETDEEGAFEMVLKYENFSDFLNQVNFAENLQNNLQNKLTDLKNLKMTLEAEKNALETEKENLTNHQNDLSVQQNILANQRQEKNSLLIVTKREHKQYQKLLSDTEAKMKAIQREIFDLEDQLRFTVDPSTIPPARAGILSWPTEGIISQYYGCVENNFAKRIYPDCNDNKGGFHNGLDIAAGLGTKIFAAADGEVIDLGNAPYAYGNWVVIKHNNGLVTLYTHMSVRNVRVGDNVIRGQTLIGYMGSSGLSTGPHLHFTVYAPNTFRVKPSTIAGTLPIGYTLNPLDYL